MENATHFFAGRIHPERAQVGVIHWIGAFNTFESIDTPIEMFIGASQILVQTAGDNGADLATLKNQVAHLAQQFCDSITWGNGCGYRVEIVSATSAAGPLVFPVDHPMTRREQEESPKQQARAVSVLTTKAPVVRRQFARALADYRQAILEPDDTAELCWRAIEALSYTVERNNDRGMDELASRLRIDRAWIRRNLEIPAAELRHGKVVAVTTESRGRALRCAQTIIDRFILLHEANLDTLGDDIPLLKEG